MDLIKIIDDAGLGVLISIIKAVRETSYAAVSGVFSLQENLQELSGHVTNAFQYTNEALTELDNGKAEKTDAVTFTIQIEGWQEDEGSDFPYFYDFETRGVTDKDKATIIIAPEGITEAYNCGLCPTNETLEDRIRIRAAQIPEAEIPAQYWIEKGKV